MADTDALTLEIEKASEKLREIDGSIHQLAGRSFGGIKRRISNEGPFDNRRIGHGVGVNDGRRRSDYGMSGGKRIRMDDDYEDDDDFRGKSQSIMSQVTLPAIDTKSRDDKIKELEVSVQKDVKQRNRRMFSNLLMGTLQKFQKDEKKIFTAEKRQAEKLKAVDNKIEESKMNDREQARAERDELMQKRRAQEKELRSLQRKKALIQYAEQKTTHYKQLQNFIGTQTKPTLFFLPAKHTLRSLELLKQSSENIEELIKIRQAELDRELAEPEENHEEQDLENNTKVESRVIGGRHAERRDSESGNESEQDEKMNGEEEEKESHHEESDEEQDADDKDLTNNGEEQN